MRCTECRYSKELIPQQINYVYCTKYESEMSACTEFDDCQYIHTDEYKIKKIISDYCNNERYQMVAINLDSLVCHVGKELYSEKNKDIVYKEFYDNIIHILKSSKMNLDFAKINRHGFDEDFIILAHEEG
jgi:hypothetical protein